MLNVEKMAMPKGADPVHLNPLQNS